MMLRIHVTAKAIFGQSFMAGKRSYGDVIKIAVFETAIFYALVLVGCM